MINTIIYLFGFAGTGKYTIAKEIAARIDARLVDNHLICNPIFSLLRLDGKTKLPPGVWDYTRQIAATVRDAMVRLSSSDENFVITNFLSQEDKDDHRIYEETLVMAEKRNAFFVPVRLVCDLPELQKRIVQNDRRARMKMTDPDKIAVHYQNYTVLNPEHPYKLELDVTHLSPQQAADVILNHVAILQG